jgi:N-glycosylase/DNA lyase
MEKLSLGTALIEPAWDCLFEEHCLTPRTLEETLIGGQAFRWYWVPEGKFWTGVWGRKSACLRINEAGVLEAAPLTPHTTLEDIRFYLGLDRLPDWISALPCNADPVLADLKSRWSGLSLLRQPPGETLLAFICSSNKQILQIRVMQQALAKNLGQPLPGTPFHRLPTWEELAAVPESGLRACALGYRAAHVAGTAEFLATHPDYLGQINNLSLQDARFALRALPGVGPKVADCVLLFGYGRAEAFPVDTWIAKCLAKRYPELAGWSREQLATFARIHFGRAAGLAQQWFFADRLAQSETSMAQRGVMAAKCELLQ